ncbi:MAG: hypothetical protein ACQCN6_01155 [Candidatus Bathyarchaeia archaeon]|jgi:hypothetical protein
MQGKKHRTSKAALAVALALLLALPLPSGASENPTSQVLSAPVQLQDNLLGVVGYCVYQLDDGSIVLNSINQSCTFLTKLDTSYNVLWTRTFQVDGGNTALPRLVVTRDGGFLLAGLVNNRYVLVKTDSEGAIQWIESYSSGAPVNHFMAVIEVEEGGYALAGFGVPVEDGLGWIWFAKTDPLGNMLWSENISGPIHNCPSTIIETDEGYVLSAVSYSFVPDQALYELIRLDRDGRVLGNTTYGGTGFYYQTECNGAITTIDGGYLMVGYLWRKPAWVVKVDAGGGMEWNQTYGENGCSITGALQTEGGYLLLEYLKPNATGVIITDKLGNTVWNTTFPNVTLPVGLEANFNSIIEAKEGGYILLASKDNETWLAKLDYPKDPPPIPLLMVAVTALVTVAAVLLVVWRTKKWRLRRLFW